MVEWSKKTVHCDSAGVERSKDEFNEQRAAEENWVQGGRIAFVKKNERTYSNVVVNAACKESG